MNIFLKDIGYFVVGFVSLVTGREFHIVLGNCFAFRRIKELIHSEYFATRDNFSKFNLDI